MLAFLRARPPRIKSSIALSTSSTTISSRPARDHTTLSAHSIIKRSATASSAKHVESSDWHRTVSRIGSGSGEVRGRALDVSPATWLLADLLLTLVLVVQEVVHGVPVDLHIGHLQHSRRPGVAPPLNSPEEHLHRTRNDSALRAIHGPRHRVRLARARLRIGKSGRGEKAQSEGSSDVR